MVPSREFPSLVILCLACATLIFQNVSAIDVPDKGFDYPGDAIVNCIEIEDVGKVYRCLKSGHEYPVSLIAIVDCIKEKDGLWYCN